MDGLGIGARAFLLRETGQADVAALLPQLTTCHAAAAKAIDRALGPTTRPDAAKDI
jgi:glutamate-ammonia-ligase adenylyltransferase